MAVPGGSTGREGSPGFGPPSYRPSPVRIACVQFDPKLGMVKQNAAKVESMIQHLRPNSIDLLVLPEMALSGYIFPTPTSILPYLEPQRIGPTSLLCRNLAKRLRCHVIAGYPEVLAADDENDDNDINKDKAEKGSGGEVKKEAMGVGWNSAMIVNKEGEVVGNYRKTFRFETDKNWAREGDGFKCFNLGEPLGRVAVGICMDMNPKDFIAPWDAFELANFTRQHQADMLVVPMNWLDPPVEPPNVAPPQDPLAPSESNLNYWAARLTPLHDPTPDYVYGVTDPSSSNLGTDTKAVPHSQGKEVIFVGCNRVGTEEGTKFIGTSCVMTVSSDPSRIELVECCNISEERVMIATVT